MYFLSIKMALSQFIVNKRSISKYELNYTYMVWGKQMQLIERLKKSIIEWLMRERRHPREYPLCDFERIGYEVRPCDILLVEGRSRISDIIKLATQSAWSHAAIYIGRIHDVESAPLRAHIREHYDGPLDEQLVIESLLGKGTIISPLSKYRDAHLRICRPKGISRKDAQTVISYSISRLGMEYGIRHIIDLARLLLPWSILPRRWRSSLFDDRDNVSNKEICSSMLAEAFSSVKFPILPIISTHKEKGVQFYQRNPRLFTPSDFDYSPFFEIIKYPLFELDGHTVYRSLPWTDTGPISSHDEIPSDTAANEEKSDQKKPKQTTPDPDLNDSYLPESS